MQASRGFGLIVTALLTACGCGAESGVVGAASGGASRTAAMPHQSEPDGQPRAGEGSGPEPEPPVADCERHQFVLAGSVTNARDLGGLPIESGGSVACGSLFRGPPLAGLTSAGCADVTALGIRTLIDLRQESERNSKPTSACVAAAQVMAPLPIPYGVSATEYLADLNAPAVADAFRAFADPEAYPIYFHCTWGRDRTGVVAALLLLALGASRQDVMHEYMLSESSVGAYPNSLNAVLDEIETRGGAEAVLSKIGISADELAALRASATVAE
jgi:hypothetical protein